MSNNTENINLGLDLRRHLVLGFVGLIVSVFIVFIYVTHSIASDLGKSIESDYIKAEIDEISEAIDRYITLGDSQTIEDKQNLNNYITSHHYLVDENVVLFNIFIEGEPFNLIKDFTYSADMEEAMSNKLSNMGIVELNGSSLFWLYSFNHNKNFEIMFIRKAIVFDRAVAYMKTRLSISAFLTFWFAVWAALIISAYITKGFVRGNIRLNFLASHDNLTNLPNRTYLYEVVNKFIAKNGRKVNKKPASMLLIDLNKFKAVNDTMGHHIGDILLTSIASRLNTFVTDDTKVFRYGGDEFILWQENNNKESVELLAEDIMNVCRKILNIRGSQFEISISIGIAHYPEDGENFNDLFKNADVAMYHAKNLRLGYQTYQKSLHSKSFLTVNLSGQLNHALKNEQFVLFYQPKVKISTGETYGFEALVRWQHPTEGLLAPNLFISIIEQSDFVHVFTRNILKKSILQCKAWLQQGLYLSVAVNLSPYNLLDGGLVNYLREQLEINDVPPELIEIELTESATMVDIEITKKVFQQFRELGVQLSIDDFGTGMSSLSYIKELPVDYIKIDRSFVIDIDKSIEDEAIVMSILLLCKKLNRKVIVEGIETKEQSNKLIELGCELAQGYYFGKPVPVDMLALPTNSNNHKKEASVFE